jgi:hypothetical protein
VIYRSGYLEINLVQSQNCELAAYVVVLLADVEQSFDDKRSQSAKGRNCPFISKPKMNIRAAVLENYR